jgi:hypothetical protein
LAILIFVLCAIFIGVEIGWDNHEIKMQKELVEKGFAEYNSITGDWQYKEQLNPKERAND